MQVTNVWETVDKNKDDAKARGFMMVGMEDDLMLVLNFHEPGYKIEFHRHCDTTQSYLVLKGAITVRTRLSVDSPVQERRLAAGDCVMIHQDEFYELENETSDPVILYQAKRPAPLIQLVGGEPMDANKYFGVEA